MKLSCIQENLNKGLNIISHLSSKNISLPILNNVLLETEKGVLSLSATNLEIGIKTKVRGKVEKEGKITIPAKIFTEYINLLPNKKIDLELKDETLEIFCENFKTKIKGISAEEFPIIPRIEKRGRLTVPVNLFKKGLGQTTFAASFDETRPEISGIFFQFNPKELILTATDSYRLAEKIIPQDTGVPTAKNIIVPLRTMQEVFRILGEQEEGEVEIAFEENQIMFRAAETSLVSRLIEGQYPDYKQIIPEIFKTKVIFPKEEMIQAVKLASLFVKSGINDINLEFLPSKKEVTVLTANVQVGESMSKIKAEIEGEKNSIVFNYRYFLDGLLSLPAEEAVLEITSSEQPGLLRPKEEKGYLYLIMPIRQ